MAFNLPNLPYNYNALEPHIDARTMEIHHTKHHQAYVNNLNKALENYPNLQSKSLESLLQDLNQIPDEIRTAVQNNGGGHYNHSLFWQIMSPKGGNRPEDQLLQAINKDLGSFEKFTEEFTKIASTRFGSGWAWLTIENNTLHICSTPNQDTPIMQGNIPILGLDVWEHAYYLNYQNRRPDYIKAWFSIINWNQVSRNFTLATDILP